MSLPIPTTSAEHVVRRGACCIRERPPEGRCPHKVQPIVRSESAAPPRVFSGVGDAGGRVYAAGSVFLGAAAGRDDRLTGDWRPSHKRGASVWDNGEPIRTDTQAVGAGPTRATDDGNTDPCPYPYRTYLDADNGLRLSDGLIAGAAPYDGHGREHLGLLGDDRDRHAYHTRYVAEVMAKAGHWIGPPLKLCLDAPTHVFDGHHRYRACKWLWITRGLGITVPVDPKRWRLEGGR